MKINNVEYKEIPGYPDYYAGYDGNIYSSKSDKPLSPTVARNGYLKVNLYDEEYKKHSKQVHRLIALTWIPNLENKPEVHHRDEDKTNNTVTNLAWVTSKENVNAGTRTQRSADRRRNDPNQSKPIVLTSVTDGTKLYFPSVKEAMRNGYHVHNVFSGIAKTTKGYYVGYVGYVESEGK